MENNEMQGPASRSTRREFIKKTSTAAAAIAATNLFKTPVYGQTDAPSVGTAGANNKITVAVIGVGAGIGQNHLKGIVDKSGDNNTAVIAACDLFNKRRDWAKSTANLKDSDVVDDYRKILDRKDVDAVVIATHDPWHAPITMDAVGAGKHVYCEKPMSRYLDEAFRAYDTVKKSNRVFQIGSQGCSAGGWHKCADLVKAGSIGTLVWSQGYYCRNSKGGEWNSPPFTIDFVANDFPGGAIQKGVSTADNIDWPTWQQPVHNKVDFSAERYHRWRKYYEYCAGVLGDLAPHRLHPLMLASGNPEFPLRVVSLGTHNVHADLDKSNAGGTPERETPEHQQLLAEFPSGYLITLTCSTVNAKSPGFVMYGHQATLTIGEGGNRVELTPEREYADDIDPATYDGLQAEDIREHEKDFFNCIRTGKVPNGNVDLAIRVQTVISLAEMSNRLNTMCLFDEKTRAITANGKTIDPITYGTLAES